MSRRSIFLLALVLASRPLPATTFAISECVGAFNDLGVDATTSRIDGEHLAAGRLELWRDLYDRLNAHARLDPAHPYRFSMPAKAREAVGWMRQQVAEMRAKVKPGDPKRATWDAVFGAFTDRIDQLERDDVPYQDYILVGSEFAQLAMLYERNRPSPEVKVFADQVREGTFTPVIDVRNLGSHFFVFNVHPQGAPSFAYMRGVPLHDLGLIAHSQVADHELKSPDAFLRHDVIHQNLAIAHDRVTLGYPATGPTADQAQCDYREHWQPLFQRIGSAFAGEPPLRREQLTYGVELLLFQLFHEGGLNYTDLNPAKVRATVTKVQRYAKGEDYRLRLGPEEAATIAAAGKWLEQNAAPRS
jgi:hypothetical protein